MSGLAYGRGDSAGPVADDFTDCKRCDGYGVLPLVAFDNAELDRMNLAPDQAEADCPACKGKGWVPVKPGDER